MKRVTLAIGALLLLLGIVGIVHPYFRYHTKREIAAAGPVHATIEEEKSGAVPIGLSVLVLVAGLALVVFGSQSKK